MERNSTEKQHLHSVNTLKSATNRPASLCVIKPSSLLKQSSFQQKKTVQHAHAPTFRVDLHNITLYGKQNREQILTIQNIGRDPIKVNITVPKTIYFCVKQEHRSFSLSAGMNKKIPIQLSNLPPDASCYDFIILQSEKQKQKIELNWYKDYPTTQYTTLIDLQKISVSKNHQFSTIFKNTSPTLSKKINLNKDPMDNIIIQSDMFTLKPGASFKVEFNISPQAQGVYHHKIIVEEDGVVLPGLEIVYVVVDSRYRIEDGNSCAVKQIDFGTLIKGVKKEYALYARNSGPKEVQLRVKVKIGKTLRTQSALQSPQELGIQSSSTVIQPATKVFKIAPFSRTKIALTAYQAIQPKEHQLVERFAKSDTLASALLRRLQKEDSEHNEVLVCQFVEVAKPTTSTISSVKPTTAVVAMKVGFSLPAIKISPSSIVLGQITAGHSVKSTLTIENFNNYNSCHIQVGKLLNSQCFMLDDNILSRQSSTLDVITKGGNLGNFKSTLQLTVSGLYHIRIPVEYQVLPACVSLFNNSNKLMYTAFEEQGTNEIDFNHTISMIEKHKKKKQYGVPIFRRLQVKSKSSSSLFNPPAETINSIRNSSTFRKDKTYNQALDNSAILEDKTPSSHHKKYPLFVTRKIDKYQPFLQARETNKLQKTRNYRDHFGQVHRQPKNRKEAEQIQRELTAEELKMIVIGDKVVSFGRLFVNSKAEAEWTIVNDTQAAIKVQLKDNGADSRKSSMLQQTDFEPQIIPAQSAGRFKIAFQALLCGKFETILSYIINSTHNFQLLVSAEVQLVTLIPSKQSLKMAYETEQDLLLSDSFTLKNQGNVAAHFTIQQSNQIFKISPNQGQIPAGSELQILIVENYKHFPVVQAGQIFGKGSKHTHGGSQFQERILIKINDGNDISLKASSPPGLADPKCLVKEAKLNFGCTIVSKEKQKSFQIKNISRNLTFFEIINEQYTQFLSFDCMKGKIPPEGTKQIKVNYKSSIIHNINSSFKVLIKGGLLINVPFSAESIAPEIGILQSHFNFGEICCDTAAIRTVNIRNNSEIAVELFFDNTGENGAQFLMPSFWGAISQPVRQNFIPKKTVKNTGTFGKGAAMEEEEIIDNALTQANIHKIKVDPESIYTFHFVFRPTQSGFYEFILPIYLENFIRNDSLTKIVSCQVIEPKFIIQPAVVKFKTKIINDKDNGCFHAFMEYVTLKNPTNHVLRWKMDMGSVRKTNNSLTSFSSMSLFNKSIYSNHKDTAQQKSCFEIQHKKGELKPKESISINVSFSPIDEGLYYHKVPLYIFNEEKGIYQQESEIRLEGEGKYPSLYFNRRELILPAVPLGIQALGMFQVQNQGYETINLKHRFEMTDPQGNIHITKGNLNGQNGLPQLSLFFPYQNKLTLNKKKTICIVKFVSRKVLSFTCKLQLYDDSTDCRAYSIPISATADNSILTTFSYISDPDNIYKFDNMTIQLDKRKKNEQISTICLKSNDGRHIIDRYHNLYASLTADSFALSCLIVKRWINNFFREEKVRQFPDDLALNQDIVLKFIHKLTNRKQFDGSYEIQLQNGQKQCLNGNSSSKLVFYEIIIRLLKQFGCLLNHIRPEYLLKKESFIQIMSHQPEWKNYSAYYLENYQILNKQAWLVVFYQLYSSFWCQRSKIQFSGKGQSNVYSVAELAVIRWVKSCYQMGNQLDNAKDKFMSFGKDYRDCLAPIYCLLRYATPTVKEIAEQNINKWPINQNQFAANTRLLYQLLETLNISPLIYEDEYAHCSDKEMFLFMHQLYELLPQLLPKGSPIIFQCQLGSSSTRTIQIRNPSSKTVHYWVKLEGSKDFQPEEKESISIEPKGVYNFEVQFRGRLSVEQVAYLSFFSKQDAESNSANGTAMVFELKSKITGRSSIKKLDTITCPLYDSNCVKIFVENIFEDSQLASFSIHLVEQTMGYNLSTIKTTQCSQDLESAQNKSLKQFYCDSDTVKIKKGMTGFVELYFTPLRLSKTKCFIIFHDPLVGEFQYEIVGVSEIPRPLQEIRILQPLTVGKREKIELNLSVYNNMMLKCENIFQQRTSEKALKIRQKSEQTFKLQLNMDHKITEHITFPREVVLRGAKKQSPENNKMKIDCLFNTVIKDCILDFLLLGDPKRQVQDVRRFKVTLVIQHPPLTQDLFISTTARKHIVQPFPIDNSSHKDWKIRVSITPNELNYFTLREGEVCLSRDMIVRKGLTQLLNIYFQPQWICQTQCKVIINNITTNEQILLNLKGVAEEPLSEDHIHIRANSDDSSMHTLDITNPYAEKTTFRIISDLEDLHLPPDVTLQANQTVPFYIFARTTSHSAQVGYIKFVDSMNRFFWYSVGLESSEKKIREFNVEFQGEVGCQIEKQIQFKNPFSKVLSYKIEYPKGFSLEGQQQFSINPHTVHHYRLKFRPERQIDQEVILKATSQEIGMFLYHIRLKARDQSKKKTIQMNVEVGKTGHHDIRLQNLRKESIKVNYQLSNDNCFSIEGSDMLHPGENTTRIKFKPAIQGKQNCCIRVWSDYFPTRCFEVQGIGLAPYSIETINFKTRPGETALEVIRFVNPRASQSTESVKVCLSQAAHGCFKIVGHECPGHWITEVKDLLAIPVQFQPTGKGYFESVLTIQCFHYQWKYLLKGTTNFQQVQKICQEIKTVNKHETIKRFKVVVPEYYSQPIAYFDKVTIEHGNKDMLRLIRRWLKLRINVPCQDQEEDRNITILAKFRPKKEIKEVVQLVLSNSKEEGPTLSYNVQLQVSESLPDSIITLDFNAIKNIAFDLNGLGHQAALSAKMLRGHHCQAEQQKQSVKLKFKPTHLLFTKGRVYTDNLLLQNEEEQWNYEVRFVLKN